MMPTDDESTSVVRLSKLELSQIKPTRQPDLDNLPLLITRNFVLFPGCTVSILLTRPQALEVARMAQRENCVIGVVCQNDEEVDTPNIPNDLFKYGVFAQVLQVIELPNEENMAIVQSFGKFKITGAAETVVSHKTYHCIAVKPVSEQIPAGDDQSFTVLGDVVKESVSEISKAKSNMLNELMMNLTQITSAADIINMVATYAPIDVNDKKDLLKIFRLRERGMNLLSLLNRSVEMARLEQELHQQTASRLNEDQRRAFMQRQIDVIKEELNDGEDDTGRLRERAQSVKLSDKAREVFDKEVDRMSRMAPNSPDYAVISTYLETLLDLPWNIFSEPSKDFGKAGEILNNDHYGLKKVKERVLEQVAVLMNNPDVKAPILCLVGAPGVGKTSLGRSVANSLNRQYQRISLGGVHDESEIRGHRRTYIGAMPGRIIDAIKRAGTSNPVLLLDEVDKLGKDIKGDPSAALLEVLDPEQNFHFHDNYIDVDFDLSKVLFIATANSLSTIPRPLLDRMEVIEISGYLPAEKIEIARRHLIPRMLDANNLTAKELKIDNKAIEYVIERYTAESGVRQLEKLLAKIVRHYILEKVSGHKPKHVIKEVDVPEILGVERYSRDRYENNDFAGVVTGLAWTEVGGEILFIESILTPAKQGGKLTLTGNLGDVMKESATIALKYVKAHSREFGINPEVFEKYDIHIHVPEGATPKDGPSAGITMATSLISTLTQRRVRERIAMTGEITLRGKVLAVGGIKEKILAAKRAGITDIIISNDNRKDINDIDADYLDGLTFHYVDTVMDVAAIAVTDQPVNNPIDIS